LLLVDRAVVPFAEVAVSLLAAVRPQTAERTGGARGQLDIERTARPDILLHDQIPRRSARRVERPCRVETLLVFAEHLVAELASPLAKLQFGVERTVEARGDVDLTVVGDFEGVDALRRLRSAGTGRLEPVASLLEGIGGRQCVRTPVLESSEGRRPVALGLCRVDAGIVDAQLAGLAGYLSAEVLAPVGILRAGFGIDIGWAVAAVLRRSSRICIRRPGCLRAHVRDVIRGRGGRAIFVAPVGATTGRRERSAQGQRECHAPPSRFRTSPSRRSGRYCDEP
jgi:hypothetical protein